MNPLILTLIISVCYIILVIILDKRDSSTDSEECEDDMVGLVCVNLQKLDEKNSSGLAPIHVALSRGCRNIARKLIELGASVNCETSQRQNTPLHYAANNGNCHPYDKLPDLQVENNRVIGTDFIELLLSKDADPNLRNFCGNAPLHIAVTGSNVDCDLNIVSLLVESGAHVDLRNNLGDTPLARAIISMNKDCVEKLLFYGANINDAVIEIPNNVLEVFSENSICLATIEYRIKLRLAGLHLNQDWHVGFIRKTYETFFHECIAEIDILKNTFIDNRTSLFYLLHMHVNKRCKYIEIEEYKNLCLGSDLEKQFPMYAIVIVGSYREAVARKNLLQLAQETLSEIATFPIPDLCVELVCEYLSNADIVSLILSLNEPSVSDGSCHLLCRFLSPIAMYAKKWTVRGQKHVNEVLDRMQKYEN